MPEAQQIGRRGAIESLEANLDGVVHQWLIGKRRIGKTSVAKAVLARLRKNGAVALDVDLSKLEASTSEGLAGDIARQAQAAHAGEAVAGRLFSFARAQKQRAKGLSRALEGLGYENEGQALDTVASLLAGADGGGPGLGKVLSALSLHARATERHAYLLLDEVHLLANLPRAEEDVAHQCHEVDSPVVFIFAGSEEAAARALRETGRPLAAVGQEFELPDIAREDWLPGLRSRFERTGVTIADTELNAIVSASEGHPRRTMLISSRVHTSAHQQPDREASPIVVELAIRDAREDRAWR